MHSENNTLSSQPLVELQDICKSFGPVKANREVSLKFYPGRIKALLGENGAGKSTLMSILAGRLKPDSGKILINNEAVRFRTSKDSLRAGIGMVYQNFMLVDSLTVAENVLLGQDTRFFTSSSMLEDTVAMLGQKYDISLNPDALVGSLSMGERQLVEIVKLLHRDSNLLIFDEPTAVLTTTETERLFRALRQMALRGKSIIFISHKLGEVLEIADEIALLRQGQVIDQFAVSEAPDSQELAERMIGRSVDLAFDRVKTPIQETVLEVEDLSTGYGQSVSFAVKRGEVLALVGVAGNGQKPLVAQLAGLSKPEQGTISIMGQPWAQYYSTPPRMNGLAYIPEDRQGLAVCLHLPLVDNVLLTSRDLFTKGWQLAYDDARKATEKIIETYSIMPPIPTVLARSLSGGNLQKLVIGRELLRNPSIIIAENPTQGLDVAATEDVWNRLLKTRDHSGVLLISSDITEALQLADRVAIMYRGRFVDMFPVTDTAKVARMGAMMAGVGE